MITRPDRPRRPDRRDFGPGPYILGAQVKRRFLPLPHAYPFVPAVHGIAQLRMTEPVTLLCGENGTGKSTLVEALAIAAGFAKEGGTLTRELGPPPAETDPDRLLADRLELDEGRHRPRSSFFLRAESFFNVAATIDTLGLAEVYGGTGLHAQSHGESFLALAANRFGPDGLFLLDEPEAALSVTGQLALIGMIAGAASQGAQFIVATHSPILLSYPGAVVYEASERGLEQVAPEDSDPVRLTRGFLAAPEQFLRHLSDT